MIDISVRPRVIVRTALVAGLTALAGCGGPAPVTQTTTTTEETRTIPPPLAPVSTTTTTTRQINRP
jgi:hypothetical protein